MADNSLNEFGQKQVKQRCSQFENAARLNLGGGCQLGTAWNRCKMERDFNGKRPPVILVGERVMWLIDRDCPVMGTSQPDLFLPGGSQADSTWRRFPHAQ